MLVKEVITDITTHTITYVFRHVAEADKVESMNHGGHNYSITKPSYHYGTFKLYYLFFIIHIPPDVFERFKFQVSLFYWARRISQSQSAAKCLLKPCT